LNKIGNAFFFLIDLLNFADHLHWLQMIVDGSLEELDACILGSGSALYQLDIINVSFVQF
jgi:hypothetical protein